MTHPPLSPVDEQFTRDPFNTVKRYREQTPIMFNEALGCWMVFGYGLMKEALASPLMTNSPGAQGTEEQRAAFHQRCPNLGWVASRMTLDPEAHRARRRLINSAFSPAAIARQERQIAEVINVLCAPLLNGGIVDFATEISTWIPYQVVTNLMGVEHDSVARFREAALGWAHAYGVNNTPEQMAYYDQQTGILIEELRRMCADRQQAPKADLITDFIRAADEQRVPIDDIIITLCGLIATGSTATKHAIDLCVHSLLTHRDQLQLLRSERSLINNAVNELLRFRTPPKFVNRYALEDTEFGGQAVKKGDLLLLCSAAAEGDPAHFDHPETLDIRRDVSSALTFGHGPHYCVGTHMARTEIRFVLEFLLDRLPADIAVLTDRVTFNANNPLTFEIASLPIDTRC